MSVKYGLFSSWFIWFASLFLIIFFSSSNLICRHWLNGYGFSSFFWFSKRISVDVNLCISCVRWVYFLFFVFCKWFIFICNLLFSSTNIIIRITLSILKAYLKHCSLAEKKRQKCIPSRWKSWLSK